MVSLASVKLFPMREKLALRKSFAQEGAEVK